MGAWNRKLALVCFEKLRAEIDEHYPNETDRT